MHYYASLSDEAERSLVLGSVLPPSNARTADARMPNKGQIDFHTAQRMDSSNEQLPHNQLRRK